MKPSIIPYTFFLFLFLLALNACTPEATDIPPTLVTPTAQQLAYQKMETVGFIHFTINTFTDKEWGYGNESPQLFNPTQLDVEQWVTTARAGGLKELILTAKHHDGFCLWPSRYTEHSIKNSPYKDGQGDVVQEFVEACRKHGLKAGLYLSPWDRNHPDYGQPEYIAYYRNQLRELLTNYGEINEIWFDGANGGDGYYGGANEVRKIDNRTYYDWDSTFRLVKELQPDILIFSDAGPDIRWVGNERGFAGHTFWSTIADSNLVIGGADQAYLNTGSPDGNVWLIGQCDVSIRPGWFYHESQDSLVKTPAELLDIYYKSVGRNGVLLLNLPPDQRGLIPEKDSIYLRQFHERVETIFAQNLAKGNETTATHQYRKVDHFSPGNILDGDPQTYWAGEEGKPSAELLIDLGEPTTFNRIMLREPIRLGQRISRFSIAILNQNEEWEKIAGATTIGYKRILKIPAATATKVKLIVEEATHTPAINEFGLYLASAPEYDF